MSWTLSFFTIQQQTTNGTRILALAKRHSIHGSAIDSSSLKLKGTMCLKDLTSYKFYWIKSISTTLYWHGFEFETFKGERDMDISWAMLALVLHKIHVWCPYHKQRKSHLLEFSLRAILHDYGLCNSYWEIVMFQRFLNQMGGIGMWKGRRLNAEICSWRLQNLIRRRKQNQKSVLCKNQLHRYVSISAQIVCSSFRFCWLRRVAVVAISYATIVRFWWSGGGSKTTTAASRTGRMRRQPFFYTKDMESMVTSP